MRGPDGLILATGHFDQAHGAPAGIQKLTTAVMAELDAIDQRLREIKEPVHLFRAVKGRVYHASTKPVRADHIERGQVEAVCGARFDRWYTFGPLDRQPTCDKCRAILAVRKESNA
jgi:hypothetical protein